MSEKDYPYKGVQSTCKFDPKKVVAKFGMQIDVQHVQLTHHTLAKVAPIISPRETRTVFTKLSVPRVQFPLPIRL